MDSDSPDFASTDFASTDFASSDFASTDSGDHARAIAAEFPAWEAWQGIDRLWHARIRGATPPVMVHGEDLVDLRDQIIRYQRRTEGGLPGGTD